MSQPGKNLHQRHELAAESLVTRLSVIDQPPFRQSHSFTAVDLAAGVLAPFGQTPAEIDYEKRLTEIISASPNRRTKSRHELVELGAIFGLSERKAKIIRELVIHKLGAKAWKNAGAPRGWSNRRTRG